MKTMASGFATHIENMLTHREKLGFAYKIQEGILANFDRFCQAHFPDSTVLTKEIVLRWIERRPNEGAKNMQIRGGVIRGLGKYLEQTGVSAYILPEHYLGGHSNFTPYILSDAENAALFRAIDAGSASEKQSFEKSVPSVLFRLIYTCGLRPQEGRTLLRKNVCLETGEILITETKGNKERVVVMSDDMLEMCRAYEEKRLLMVPDSAYFFPRADGTAFSSRMMERRFQWYWVAANPQIPADALPRLRVYDLRHRFASAVLNRWLDEKKNLHAMLPRLRAYMGHSEIAATAYYIHLLPENLVKSDGIDWGALSGRMPEVDIWPQ